MRPPREASRGVEPWGPEYGPSGGRRGLTSHHLRSGLATDDASSLWATSARRSLYRRPEERKSQPRQDSRLDDAQDAPGVFFLSSPSQVPCRPLANWAAAGSLLRGAFRPHGPETFTVLVAKPQRRRTRVLLQAERSGWSAALWVVPTPPPSRDIVIGQPALVGCIGSGIAVCYFPGHHPLRGRVRDLNERPELPERAPPVALPRRPRMEWWVRLGVIANNLIAPRGAPTRGQG
jgi:hypothetical protein